MPYLKLRRHFWIVALALGAPALVACGSAATEAALASDDMAGTGGGFTSGSAATGSGSGGGSIDLAPDAGENDAQGIVRSFASYCGSGTPCTPGGEGQDALCNAGPAGQGGGQEGALSCQLVPAEGGATATCSFAGAGVAGAACASASDCAPGLGCVGAPQNGAPSGGQCRAYCCGDPEDCPGDTYCSLQVLTDTAAPTTTEIPACVPVTHCELLSQDPQCPAGTSCTIVREDGTTSCLPTGVGQDCDPCPCADGYVCSAAMNQCKKLCHTSGQYDDECGGGYCLSGVGNLPMGIGVCSSADGC